jgi:hypothetical protein
MVHGCQIPTDSVSLIDNYRDVWDATEGTAGGFDLLVILVK